MQPSSLKGNINFNYIPMESVKPPVITEYQESYPSELSIIYSAICTVEGICGENYINRGSVTMVCDSLGEIQKSMAK